MVEATLVQHSTNVLQMFCVCWEVSSATDTRISSVHCSILSAHFCDYYWQATALKVKGQDYSLISSLKVPGLDLFIRVPCQLHGEPFRHIELRMHIVISVLPGNHLNRSQVKLVRVKCSPNDTTSTQCRSIEKEETLYFL